MKLTTEQQKEAIEFAKTYKEKTGSFPKAEHWVMKNVAFEIDNGEEIKFPYAKKAISATFGNYNKFRKICDESIIKWNSNDPVTLEVLRDIYCIEKMCSKNPEITTPCWVWQGAKDRGGYAKKDISVNGHSRKWTVHIYVLEILLKKPKLSEEHTVDHICRVRDCINPDHLRWATGTQQRNNQTSPENRVKPRIRPPHHKTLTERVQWYMDQGIEDVETGCMILPLSLEQVQQIEWKDIGYTAHILIYLLHRDGEVTPESYILFREKFIIRHMCAKKTNHMCCNPEHLKELPNTKEGHRQNSLDAVSYSKSTKLVPQDVVEIRELFEVLGIETNWGIMERYSHIASIFNVASSTITAIIVRRTWVNVAA